MDDDKYDPDVHHRRSVRLKEYDYSEAGAYFVTICVNGKKCLFGDIVENKLILNQAGEMIKRWFMETGNKFLNTVMDEFIVMPNHFHGIVVIDNKSAAALGDIVDWFKTMTTNEYIRGVKLNKWEPFNGKLWQRNYYEHVVRNENELAYIREYVVNNNLKWAEDKDNPINI